MYMYIYIKQLFNQDIMLVVRWLLLFHHQVLRTLFAAPWTTAPQAPMAVGFPRLKYWSRLPFPSRGDLPTQVSNPYLLPCRWILDTEPPEYSYRSH